MKYGVRPKYGGKAGDRHSGSSGVPVGSPGDAAAVLFSRLFVSNGRIISQEQYDRRPSTEINPFQLRKHLLVIATTKKVALD